MLGGNKRGGRQNGHDSRYASQTRLKGRTCSEYGLIVGTEIHAAVMKGHADSAGMIARGRHPGINVSARTIRTVRRHKRVKLGRTRKIIPSTLSKPMVGIAVRFLIGIPEHPVGAPSIQAVLRNLVIMGMYSPGHKFFESSASVITAGGPVAADDAFAECNRIAGSAGYDRETGSKT